VIATAYSGNLDFMTSENSLLADCELVPAGSGHDPYPADGVWAEPDLDHAAALMRRVFDERDLGRTLGVTAAADIRRLYAPDVVGDVVNRRLESIAATGRARRAHDPAPEMPPVLSRLRLRARQGPAPGAVGGPGGRVREYARRATLRLMRPYSTYQQSINSELVAAMVEMNNRSADLRTGVLRERAQLLAELRATARLRARLEADARDELR
jgi:hypothetical protein